MSALAKASAAGLVPSSVVQRLGSENMKKKKKKKMQKKMQKKSSVVKKRKREGGEGPSVVLFKTTDVRVYDNPAFRNAAAAGKGVLPLFVWNHEQGSWGCVGAHQVYLKESLRALSARLRSLYGLNLVLRQVARAEDVAEEIAAVVAEAGSRRLFHNREFLPEAEEMEARLAKRLGMFDVAVESFNAALLYEPSRVALQQGFHGGHWGTLMPFVRACQRLGPVPDCAEPPSRSVVVVGGGGEAVTNVLSVSSIPLDELALAVMPVRKVSAFDSI